MSREPPPFLTELSNATREEIICAWLDNFSNISQALIATYAVCSKWVLESETSYKIFSGEQLHVLNNPSLPRHLSFSTYNRILFKDVILDRAAFASTEEDPAVIRVYKTRNRDLRCLSFVVG